MHTGSFVLQSLTKVFQASVRSTAVSCHAMEPGANKIRVHLSALPINKYLGRRG